jgi:hypothetical protein
MSKQNTKGARATSQPNTEKKKSLREQMGALKNLPK